MLSYVNSLTKTLVNNTLNDHVYYYSHVCYLFNNYHQLSHDEIYNYLRQLIGKVQISNRDRITEKIHNITNLVIQKPSSILDIGAGDGQITQRLQSHYNLQAGDVFVLDPKSPESAAYTKISMVNNVIPLPDNSVDLVILFSVLHHIDADARLILLQEIKRVIATTGIIIVREHDDDKSADFKTYCDLLHMIWYVLKDETSDPLELLSSSQLDQLFLDLEIYRIAYSPYNTHNPQKLYYAAYSKIFPM